ncbi:MAG TPA: DUF3870 domain-containing protein [Spirochaetales bacterium]|nr:DUF3870 domain-containing protein [Spirochaetales bacterium]
MYDPSTIYVVGNAKTNTENAITTLYNSFYIGFVLDPATGRIVTRPARPRSGRPTNSCAASS